MPVIFLRYTFSVCLAFLCTISIFSQSKNPHSMIYDLVVVGYDVNIDQNKSEKIGILSTIDIYEGYRFGIINKLPNSNRWVSYENRALAQISFEVKQGVEFRKGTLFEVVNYWGSITIISDRTDITNLFEIKTSDNVKFFNSSGTFITVHSGYYTKSNIMLGSILDVITHDVPRSSTEELSLPTGFKEKDLVTSENPNSGGGMIDFENCNLCDIISIILDANNWIDIPNTSADDADLSDFNLSDCAELDCVGRIDIEEVDCEVTVNDHPCDQVARYKWQKLIDGVFTTVASGVGPDVPSLVLEPGDKYRIVLICRDGCEYSHDSSAECEEDDCEADLHIVPKGCNLLAVVTGCKDPIYNWYYIGVGGSISQAGNTESIYANTDFNYFLVVSGCCENLSSDYYSMVGCLDCDCNQTLVADGCVVTAMEEGCADFYDLWEYSEMEDGPWEVIDFHGLSYTAEMTGFYRRTLIKDGCNDVFDIEEVVCDLDCDDFEATTSFDENCNIVIDYFGCSKVTDIQFAYSEGTDAQDCNYGSAQYAIGGGYVISNTDNGQNGTIIFDPSFEESCYLITITCANGCVITLFEHTGNCCSGNLLIDESNGCEIVVSNNPCTSNLTYTWFLDGQIYSQGSGTSIPTLDPTQNGLYQLMVVCDGCAYYSNDAEVLCVEPPCMSSVDIIPNDCVLEANVVNCPDAMYQWQIWNGNNFEDISGENNDKYLATDTTQIRVIITGCDNCEDEEPLSDIYTPLECEDMCDCIVNLSLDEENCILYDSGEKCDDVLYESWWQSNDGGFTWFFLIDAIDPNTYTPMDNALYKKVVEFWGVCPDKESVVEVDCLEDCTPNVGVTLTITDDCYLKASWTGCTDYESNGFGWYFAGDNQSSCDGNSNFPLSLPQVTDIIETEINPANQSGYIIIDPSYGEGCYFFNFQCEGCEVIQKSKEVGPCCEDEPLIELTTQEEEICDFCYGNQNPHIVTEIDVILPDGSEFSLSNSLEFSFPYCHEDMCANTIANLVDDLNNWFTINGYLGEAFEGAAPSGCKGDAVFYIVASNIEFTEIFVIEDGAPPSFPLTKSNCNDVWTTTLTVIDECEDATYFWSDGSISESTPLPDDYGTDINVIVKCPDSCIYNIDYEWEDIQLHNDESISETRNQTPIVDAAISQDHDVKIYPNPTRSLFNVETGIPIVDYIKVSIYNTQGQVVKTNLFSKVKDREFTIDTDLLLGGMYFIETEIDGEVKSIDKLLVIK